MQGTMIWFNPAKHRGLIRTDEGELERAARSCEARAVNVAVVPLMAERRARLRRSH